MHTGVIGTVGEVGGRVVGDNFFAAATSLLFGSAVLGAFFDNIPYTATMAPIVEGVVAQAPDPQIGQALWWAFALGADFGGNGTAVGGQRQRGGHRHRGRGPGTGSRFWEFTKYGILVTLLSAVLAWLYVWLRYFV